METIWWVPGASGLVAVLVMTVFLRRARFFHLPETQMIRAVGSMISRNYESALLPGTIIHTIAGVIFAYFYALFLSTAPETSNPYVILVVCLMMGFVHGLIVTLFLVISVAQYHPIERFRKLEPGDMISHVIAHIAYGGVIGFGLGWFPIWFG